MALYLSSRDEIDFQVRTMIGYIGRVVEEGMDPWYFFGEVSEWSSTQTVTIPKDNNEAQIKLNQHQIQLIPQTNCLKLS